MPTRIMAKFPAVQAQRVSSSKKHKIIPPFLQSYLRHPYSGLMSKLTDKIVLITGAGKGIGHALAHAFAAGGAVIAANDITPINLDVLIDQITKSGGRAKAYVTDISKKMPIQTMVNEILDDWGRIDILITNARVEPRATVLEMDEWELRRTLDVNLIGSFLILQTVGRVMRSAGGGDIIHIVGKQGGIIHKAAYNTSMVGLSALTQFAATELIAYNIRINAVCQDASSQEDVVQTVLDLCSQEAGGGTGRVIEPGESLVK